MKFVKQSGCKYLIIFVHGFTSGDETWVNDYGRSYHEYLMEDPYIESKFDFAYLSYYSKITDFDKIRSLKNAVIMLFKKKVEKVETNVSISELSEFAFSSINIFCEKYEKIVVIAHSMGGLVMKSVILDELQKSDIPKIDLFLSFAVPHKGSDWATFGKMLFSNKQIIDLAPMSPSLNKLNDMWIQKRDVLPETIYFRGLHDKQVEKDSAIAFSADTREVITSNDDHFSITKPKSVDNLVFQATKKYIRDFLTKQTTSTEQSFVDKGQYNEELFVLRLLIADVHHILINNAKRTFFRADYAIRSLRQLGITEDKLEDLYGRLENLYTITFGEYLNGVITDGNGMVTAISQKIVDQDMGYLKSSYSILKADQKTGMLHQLANDHEKDIRWAKDRNITSIEELREAKLNDR